VLTLMMLLLLLLLLLLPSASVLSVNIDTRQSGVYKRVADNP